MSERHIREIMNEMFDDDGQLKPEVRKRILADERRAEKEVYSLPGSIGEYQRGLCPTCLNSGYKHIVDICRICGAPPALDGKCVCDWHKVKHDEEE